MSVEELQGKRKVIKRADGLSATREYITTWADRYSTDLPQPGAAHPDVSTIKVIEHDISEYGTNATGSPSHAMIIIRYASTAPGLATITSTSISFEENTPSKDTITISGGGYVAAGFIAGKAITVSGSASNDGTYTIYSVTDTILTLIADDDLAVEAAGATVTITQNDVLSEDSLEFGIEAVTLPGEGVRVFSNSNKMTDDIVKLVPRAVYTYHTILDRFPFAKIKTIVGKINSDTFLTSAAGTWLFLGVSAQSSRDNSGDKIWDVQYKFQYQDVDGSQHGWNWYWDKVAAAFVEITTNPPYESTAFADLEIYSDEA